MGISQLIGTSKSNWQSCHFELIFKNTVLEKLNFSISRKCAVFELFAYVVLVVFFPRILFVQTWTSKKREEKRVFAIKIEQGLVLINFENIDLKIERFSLYIGFCCKLLLNCCKNIISYGMFILWSGQMVTLQIDGWTSHVVLHDVSIIGLYPSSY